MKVIRGRENIEAAQTVKFPTSYEVSSHAPHYVKGYVTCYYTFDKGWMFSGHHETFEEAVKSFDETKWLYDQFPEMFNWMNVSDRVIFKANGVNPRNPSDVRWYACAMMVDE